MRVLRCRSRLTKEAETRFLSHCSVERHLSASEAMTVQYKVHSDVVLYWLSAESELRKQTLTERKRKNRKTRSGQTMCDMTVVTGRPKIIAFVNVLHVRRLYGYFVNERLEAEQNYHHAQQLRD